MSWITQTLFDQCSVCRPRLVGLVFGVVSVCCAFSAVAGSSADSVISDAVFSKSFAEMDVLPEIGSHAEVISDIDLSMISGKGTEAAKLEGNDKFAVLLWDERGNGNRRTSSHDFDGGQGFQTVTLTVNR